MSEDAKRPVALLAVEAPPRPFRTNYPEPFASRMAGRDKRPLGDLFGLTNFGVNITRLVPGGCSALRHAHTKQDEFVYILEGRPTLVTDAGRMALHPACAPASRPEAATAIASSTKPARTLSTSKSATGPRAMRWTTPTTTSPW
jgi:uncharacterized cupin superfamily protein